MQTESAVGDADRDGEHNRDVMPCTGNERVHCEQQDVNNVNKVIKQLSIKSAASSGSNRTVNGSPSANAFIRPKLVTVFRNGSKPRKSIRVLLNKKTVHSLEQVLGDISQKFESGTVRKLYSQRGKQVVCLQDLFGEEDVFVAYGLEKFCSDDLNLDVEESKCVYINKTSSLNRHTPKKRISSDSKRVSSPLSSKYSSPHSNGNCVVATNGNAQTPNGRLSNNCVNSPKQHRTSHRVLFSVANDAASKNAIHKSLTKHNSTNRNQINFFKSNKHRPKNGDATPNTANGNHCAPSNAMSTSISILFQKEVIQKYEIGLIIGDGNFAVVHECVHKSKRKQFALKIIDKTKCKGKEAMVANEVAILRKVKHANIIELIEDFDYPNELYLVMELVTGGDLFDAIDEASKYDEYDASRMIYNLSSALSYLHSLNICHRDIKPENLLVCEHSDGSKSLKLGDFGLAVEIKPGEKLRTVCGTPTYVAPEILAETGYSLKVDVWAAGVIAYILLCGFPPFLSQSNDQDELFDQILRGNFEFTPPYWDDISESAKELISNMLQVDDEKRYSALQVVQHPWVAGDTTRSNDCVSLNSHLTKNTSCNCSKAGVSLITNTKVDHLPLSANFIFKEYANTSNQINNGYDCGAPFELQQPQAFEDLAF